MELTCNYIARKETEYEALKGELESLRLAEQEFPTAIQTAFEDGNR